MAGAKTVIKRAMQKVGGRKPSTHRATTTAAGSIRGGTGPTGRDTAHPAHKGKM
jgi:hypothetical protein